MPSDLFHAPSESHLWNQRLALALSERWPSAQAPVVTARAGQVLLPSGQPITRLPLLLSGRLDCVLPVQQGESGPFIPISFEAGEIAMLSQLFCNRPVWVDVVVAREARLRWLPVPALEALIESDSTLLHMLTRFLAHRLRDVQLRERSWVERGVQQRVRLQLQRLAEKITPDPQGVRTLHTTHEELAARCGVSRPKLSLALKRLEQQGRLLRGRGRLDLLPPSCGG